MKIINLKTNKSTIKFDNINTNYNKKGYDIITPPSNKEWNNIIYKFNKKCFIISSYITYITEI